MKKVICAIFCMIIYVFPVCAEDTMSDITVTFNSMTIYKDGWHNESFSNNNIVYNGATYLPLVDVAESFGCTVKNSGISPSRIEILKKRYEDLGKTNGTVNVLPLTITGETKIPALLNTVVLGGAANRMSSNNLVYNGVVYVHVRAAAEDFGYVTIWNETEPNKIYLNKKRTEDYTYDGEVIYTTMFDILAHPERYIEKKVCFVGYCNMEFENACIYPSETAAKYRNYEHEIKIDLNCTLDEEKMLIPYDFKMVKITGILSSWTSNICDKPDYANTPLYLYNIENVEEVKESVGYPRISELE